MYRGERGAKREVPVPVLVRGEPGRSTPDPPRPAAGRCQVTAFNGSISASFRAAPMVMVMVFARSTPRRVRDRHRPEHPQRPERRAHAETPDRPADPGSVRRSTHPDRRRHLNVHPF